MGKGKAATRQLVDLVISEELELLMLGDEVGINRTWARMLEGGQAMQGRTKPRAVDPI